MRTELRGICPVLPTPFGEDGALDEESLERLTDHVIEGGVDAVACLGLASEAYKLTDDERRRVVARVAATAAGRVPVVAGADHSGTEAAIARAAETAAAGADALMVYPPTFVKPDLDGVRAYYLSIAREVELPIVIQDALAWTGVPLPVPLLVELHETAPKLAYVKVESPPAAAKIAALVAAGLHAVSGYGILHLPEEVTAGATSAMPGAALIAHTVALWRASAEELWALHAQGLPLLAFQMSSLDVFVGVQKLLLRRAGVIADDRVRAPGATLTPTQVEWLDLILHRTGLERYG